MHPPTHPLNNHPASRQAIRQQAGRQAGNRQPVGGRRAPTCAYMPCTPLGARHSLLKPPTCADFVKVEM